MIEKLLQIALAEDGYLEKKSNSQLDERTANAGKNNYTKYARDLDNMPGFYNGKKNGYAWCDVFVDWCFVKAFGVEKAKELLCQPSYSLGAGTNFSLDYYKIKGQFYKIPQKGDQIFFKNIFGSICHTGIVTNVDNLKVYTIEGNTSSDAGVVANGGAVNQKNYLLNYNRIAGYGRPKYDEPIPVTPVINYSIIYQVYDNIKGRWLSEISSNTQSGNMSYAGNYGHNIGGIRIRTSNNSYFELTSHIKNGNWLGKITKWDDTSNGYSGIKNKSIDGISINATSIKYRVHTAKHGWYSWITTCNINDWRNGVAGNKGEPIDAIEIKTT